MTVYFPIFLAFCMLSCLPAWFASRRRDQAGRWSLCAVLSGLIGWYVLAAAGVGRMGLPNLVAESFDLALGSIVLYYLKVFILDRYAGRPARNSAYLVVVALGAAVLLRLFMPEIPG
jgi:hypothetical protein